MEASKERKMKMNINEMEKRFGSVKFEGTKYIIIDDVYMANRDAYGDAVYRANAIKDGDAPDGGYLPVYEVEWEISNPQAEDEADACDWDSPADVRDEGATLDLEDGHIF